MSLEYPDIDFGDIHIRDRLQFELKSDFTPHPTTKHNLYTQEFYIFLPEALQIHPGTYSKDEFYRDQTNYIRYKTPVFTFEELLDPKNSHSPLTILEKSTSKPECQVEIEYEIKLLGNIFRSTLRNKVQRHLDNENIELLCSHIQNFRALYQKLWDNYNEQWKDNSVDMHFRYVDEFISNTINAYLVNVLKTIRSLQLDQSLDKRITGILISENKRRDQQQEQIKSSNPEEFILYRRGLLNKFVGGALLLSTNRFSLKKAVGTIIAAYSAGIAMLIFLILFIWISEVFHINSTPFVIATVFFYILKDRIKEGLKQISYRKAPEWFPDYTTNILSPDEHKTLGTLKESYSLLSVKQIPKDIQALRNKEFHTVLEYFIRPEKVIYHKKIMSIANLHKHPFTRRQGLNLIYRFNIQHFIQKASNPYHSFTTVDLETEALVTRELPKVYHLNIIIRNTFIQKDLTQKAELKKYRIVIDKNGIRRVEQIPETSSEGL